MRGEYKKLSGFDHFIAGLFPCRYAAAKGFCVITFREEFGCKTCSAALFGSAAIEDYQLFPVGVLEFRFELFE